MTLDDACTVAAIIGTADNGCSTCINAQVERFHRAFPQFKLTVTDEYQRETPDPEYPDETFDVGLIITVEQIA